MAQLNSSNVSNGNIVESTDILQLYDALTSGGGTTGVYDVSISGSLTGSSTTSITAISASNITTAVTGGGTHYLTFVDQSPGTRPPKIASLLEYNAATNNLNVSASYALTASYASNVTPPTYLSGQQISTIGAGPFDRQLRLLAGEIKMSAGQGATPSFPALVSKTLGTDCFVTATVSDPNPVGSSVTVRSLSGGIISFYTVSGSGTENVHFHVMYVP